MIPTFSLLRACAALSLLALLGGCATMQRPDDNQWAATAPMQSALAPPADGSIYHDAGSLELFADPRAHRVGDILTIVLRENTQASKKATTSTSKTDQTNIAAPILLGNGLTLNGNPANIGLSADRSFSGNGASTQSNQLVGEITVTVAQRLTNGNLLVRGEKWLTINQGQELVRISGLVRPQDIGPNNTVASSRVADARIGYTGRGSLADANTQGWLSRVFNSGWMPL